MNASETTDGPSFARPLSELITLNNGGDCPMEDLAPGNTFDHSNSIVSASYDPPSDVAVAD